mgnify:CR=1 FL=1|tara:strand:+ start:317 stop:544 length:228 start_codon:yes stop_codon:yes gene_type:complete
MSNELIKFKNKDFNIDDEKTSKNLNRIQAQEIIKLNILLEDYKHLLDFRMWQIKNYKETLAKNKIKDIKILPPCD